MVYTQMTMKALKFAYNAHSEQVDFNDIPDNMKESFRREVIQLMVEKTKQKDGTCFEAFRRINVTAIK